MSHVSRKARVPAHPRHRPRMPKSSVTSGGRRHRPSRVLRRASTASRPIRRECGCASPRPCSPAALRRHRRLPHTSARARPCSRTARSRSAGRRRRRLPPLPLRQRQRQCQRQRLRQRRRRRGRGPRNGAPPAQRRGGAGLRRAPLRGSRPSSRRAPGGSRGMRDRSGSGRPGSQGGR
jgi:hypothetical protein